MDKTSKKVTKDPKRQERGIKSHKTYMKRLKEKILEDNQPTTLSPTDRRTPFSTGDSMSSTPSHTTRSSETYIYGIKHKKKPIGDGMVVTTVDVTAAKKSIGDIQAITTLVATTVGMFFALRGRGGVQQQVALLTSTSLLFLIYLP